MSVIYNRILRRGARLLRPLRRLLCDARGATTLEWALLLGAIALPSYFIFRLALGLLVEHYRMMTQLNSLPLP